MAQWTGERRERKPVRDKLIYGERRERREREREIEGDKWMKGERGKTDER